MDAFNRKVLRLALPSIFANLTVPLVGMVDIAVAGHLSASAAALIGGISVGSLMFDILYWNFGFLRAGTGGMTAQAFGRGDWSECVDNLTRGVGLALLIALVLILIQWPFQKLTFLFIGCSEEVRSLALDYFHIRIWAAPATLSLMAFRGWFIGMQDTFSSMLTDVIVNVGNIIFSIILTFGFAAVGFNGLGFKGIAFGTVLAQYSGLLFASAIALRKLKGLSVCRSSTIRPSQGARRPLLTESVCPEDETMASRGVMPGDNIVADSETMAARDVSAYDGTVTDEETMAAKGDLVDDCAGTGFRIKRAFTGEKVRRFFSVNRDLFIRSVCLIIVYLAFTAISARFGDTLLASCSILLKLLLVFSYFTDGFAFAGEALTGRFVGAGRPKMVRRTVNHTFAWSMGIGVFFVAVYAVSGVPMILALTSDPAVVEVSRNFIPWLVFFPLISCPAFTWDGIYIGATATKTMRDSNIGCVAAFFAVWFLGILFFHPQGIRSAHLLFAAYYAHLIYRSIYQTILYPKSVLFKSVSK